MKKSLDLNAVVREVAKALQATGHVRTVFGDPVKLDSQTIVPVAAVAAKVAGGGGEAGLLGGGGGGSFKLNVLPVGFIVEKDGEPTFTFLDLPYERLTFPSSNDDDDDSDTSG